MKQPSKVMAVLIIAIIYAFSIPKKMEKSENDFFIEEFKFKDYILYEPTDIEGIKVREVHPDFKNFNTWISSVGAAISVFDFDNDGIENDMVHIDPRFNSVVIAPIPGTADRYRPIQLTNKKQQEDKTIAATGVLTNDYNEDGQMDILVMYVGRSPLIYYNTENGFIIKELCEKEIWNSTTGTLADFNRDGHADIFIGNYFPDNSMILDANAKDHNVRMQHSMSKGDNGGKNRILLWNGVENGVATFKEDENWLKKLDFPNDWTLAVAAADINNDMLPDLYISNDFGPDKLLINNSDKKSLKFESVQGERKFNTIRSAVLGTDSFKGMGADFSDLNNDGYLDIYVSNIAADYALHESHFMFMNTGETEKIKDGIAPYINKSESLGLSRSSWGWDSKLGDFNNDGVKEAIQATGFVKGEINRWPQLQELATINDELLAYSQSWPNLQPGDDLCGNAHVPFFVQDKNGKFHDVSKNIGLGINQISRGLALVDANHDGKLDVLVANQWEASRYYLNESPNTNTFLGLQLFHKIDSDSSITNQRILTRPAIGATARINFKDTILFDYVDGGNGHSGADSKEIIFGLGNHPVNQPIKVDFEWVGQDGKIQSKSMELKPGWNKVIL